VYQLPFGHGRRFGSGSSGVVNTVIGNWAVSSAYTFHSGAPIGWGNVIYYGGDLKDVKVVIAVGEEGRNGFAPHSL